MKCFKNAQVYVYGKGIIKTDVAFDEIIKSTQSSLDASEIKLPEGAVVLPGFIDIHVHGAGGCDFMDGTAQAIRTIDKTLAREGTTRYLATTMTQSEENISRALKAVANYRGAGLLGVHLEGPFISPDNVGAQPAEYVKKPDIALFDKFNEEANGRIKTVTVAPETDGAASFIKHLKDNKIFVSIGHTCASTEHILSAMQAGADRVTHTFNAQSGIHHRNFGAAGCALLYDGLYCEIIADGIHVCPEAVNLLVKCKPKNKVILVTDGIRAKAFGDGVSELGGQTIFVKGGEARLADGTLAGSVLKMNEAVANAVKFAGVPLSDAVDFASVNPARSIGLKGMGAITEGNAADFAVLLPDGSVAMTIRDGEIIYER